MLRRLPIIWKQGLVLILTFVVSVFGFIAVIRPLKLLKDQIDDDKTQICDGYYSFIVNGFNCSDLELIEKDISGYTSEYLVACQKEFDVEYLNFKGRGNAIVITDYQINRLEKSYGEEQFDFYKFLSGRIPNSITEVLVLDFAYSEWTFDTHSNEKIVKSAVLPEIGECTTTGKVTTDYSLAFPTELRSGFIVNKEAFERIPNSDKVTIFVVFDKCIDASKETELKKTISKYAEVEDASYSVTRIDTSDDEAALILAIELSALVIFFIVLGEIIVVCEFLKGDIGYINTCSQLGLSKLRCCLLSQLSIVILLVIAEFVVFIILKLSETNDAISFLNIGHPIDLWVLLFQFVIVMISANYIYSWLKRKECQ